MKTSWDKSLIVTMPDGSYWSIPVHVIANHRAIYYFSIGDFFSIAASLKEDTIPLFDEDDYNIIDWAQNNMNWDKVKLHARLEKAAPLPDYQDGWINGEKEIA